MSAESDTRSDIEEVAADDNANGEADEATVEDGSKEDSSLIYKIEWADDKSLTRQNFESKVSFGPLEIATENVDRQKHVHTTRGSKAPIEIITPIWGRAKKGFHNVLPDDYPSSAPEHSRERPSKKRLPNVSFEDIKIRKVGKTKMIIRSQPLLETIRKCVTYYPGKSLTGDEVELEEPYPILIHHLDILEATQGEPDLGAEARNDLKSIVAYIHEYIKPRINSTMEKLRKSTPTLTFDELWLLFKPGLELFWNYVSVENVWSIPISAVLMDTNLVTPSESEKEQGEKERLEIALWGLESNGKILGRELGHRFIAWYEGERQVTSLPVYPFKYRDSEDGGKTRQAMIDRGHKAFQILRAMPKQMWYDGYAFSRQKQVYRGTCVLDTDAYLARKDKLPDANPYKFLESEITFQSDDSDMFGQELSDFEFGTFHHINLATTTSLPSDQHYFLMQPIIAGFALYDKTWKLFNVELLTEVRPTMVMDNLIIDPINRDIIQAITYAQSDPFRFDYAQNKGEGHVVLLHGPPGVGKTYTVECLARTTGRPLISLTMGDLMHEEEKVEEELMEWFALSERWKAILLLDEADIFLERRAARDIQRNGIVSIFLRRMEYFRGLLFLTTNRVGAIDDAFLSRVSAVLQYDHLSDDTRKRIWEGFFNKLQKDAKLTGGKKIEVGKYAQQYVLYDQEVRELRWNGREIRNALQTAVSLANYKALQRGMSTEEPVEVEPDHFHSVVSMSQKFKTYMQDISGRDEDERAKARMERTNPGKGS